MNTTMVRFIKTDPVYLATEGTRGILFRVIKNRDHGAAPLVCPL